MPGCNAPEVSLPLLNEIALEGSGEAVETCAWAGGAIAVLLPVSAGVGDVPEMGCDVVWEGVSAE